MTVWSPDQIGQFWTRNGGLVAVVSVAVAIALAESGGNDQAVSPSDDWGLWQINGVHAGAWPGAPHAWLDPDTNARAAIAISSNGSDWGPWCTAWDPGQDRCGNYLGPVPQADSPAGRILRGMGQAASDQQQSINQAAEGPNAHQMRAQWDLLTYTYRTNVPNVGSLGYGTAGALARLREQLRPPA